MTEDVEAERAVLGAVLVDPDLLPAAAASLTPADFARPSHRAIFGAVLRAEASGLVDLVTVKSALDASEQAEAAGGAGYLAGLVDGLPRVSEKAVLHWSGRVRERARLRSLQAKLADLSMRAARPDATVETVAEALDSLALERDESGATILDRADVGRRAWALIDEELSNRASGLTTGLPCLNQRLRFGGWRPGQLVYIGARTSRGKSALLLGMAEAAAAAGHPTLMFPLEMSAEELGVRRLVAESGVSVRSALARGTDGRSKALTDLGAASSIFTRPLDFAASDVRTLAGIRAACARGKKRGLNLVVIDYLGLIRDQGGRREASLYERTTAVSQALKALALELQVAVLCAVQLNRAGTDRPSLSHFRDSGAVEQDCDIALLIHQAETHDAIRQGWAELILAKQRNGPTGDGRVWWNSECARFEDRS